MEFWNRRNLAAPPTYTYQANADDIDVNHFKSILQDGISFYNDQNFLNVEVALLSRIVYRMKSKFRNSKDFKTLEQVKKELHIFDGIHISEKLEYLLSVLPSFDYHEVTVLLPTKNMIDFILVRLQCVGKILCRAMETCKKTFILYEQRLYLGHFWKLALIAIALVSRIHILCLNIIKFTCLLYLRLVPFSHKLKNVTTNWLPKDYVLPKDLKSWLNVEWCKLEEVIEIPDNEFNMSLIDLVDSDDEVEFIEINDVTKIIEDFRKIRRSQIEKLDFDSVSVCTSKQAIDLGEEIVIEEDELQIEEPDTNTMEESDKISSLKKHHEGRSEEDIGEEMDIGQEISENDSCSVSHKYDSQNVDEVDIGEVISSEDEISANNPHNSAVQSIEKKNVNKKKSYEVIISSSDDEDVIASVEFEPKTIKSRKPCMTADFIPLEASKPSLFENVKLGDHKRSSKGKKKIKNLKDSDKDVVIIPDSPNSSTYKNNIPNIKRHKKGKALKRKFTDEIGNTGKSKVSPKKKRK